MKRSRKVLAILLTAILLVGSISGCSNSKSSSSATSNKPVTITHWLWVDNASYMSTMQLIADNFHRANPNITVKMQTYAYADFNNVLTSALAGGGGPDTASFKLTWVPSYTPSKYLVDLDSAISKWTKKSDIIPMLWDKMKSAGNGKVYTMPWAWQVLYVYYRPSLWKLAGITAAPTTFDDFIADIKKCTMKVNGKQVYGFAIRGTPSGQEVWGSFVQAYGGRFQDSKGNVTLNTPETVAATQEYIDLFKGGYSPPSSPIDGLPQLEANFINGTTAMWIHHIGSSVDMVKALGDDVQAFPIPKGSGGQWASFGDTENVVLSSSKNVTAAEKWVEYLAEADADAAWDTTTGNLAVCQSVANMSSFADNRFVKVSMESASYSGIFPILPTSANWLNNLWSPIMQQAMTGKISAADAVKQLDTKLKG